MKFPKKWMKFVNLSKKIIFLRRKYHHVEPHERAFGQVERCPLVCKKKIIYLLLLGFLVKWLKIMKGHLDGSLLQDHLKRLVRILPVEHGPEDRRTGNDVVPGFPETLYVKRPLDDTAELFKVG